MYSKKLKKKKIGSNAASSIDKGQHQLTLGSVNLTGAKYNQSAARWHSTGPSRSQPYKMNVLT